MKSVIARILGILFVVTAALGLLFSLFLLVQVWRVKPVLSSSLTSSLDALDSTLITTTQGLTLLQSTIDSTSSNVAALQATTDAIKNSLHETGPVMDTLITLSGTDLPNTISNTQHSLVSAQTSARLIDNIIGAVTSIPLLGLPSYRPDVPLSQALGQVAGSLNSLPPALKTINTGLSNSRGNLTIAENQMTIMSQNFSEISQNLKDAQTAIQEYQAAVSRMDAHLHTLRGQLDGWISSVAWILSLVILWLAITQVGIFIYGLELLGIRLREPAPPAE